MCYGHRPYGLPAGAGRARSLASVSLSPYCNSARVVLCIVNSHGQPSSLQQVVTRYSRSQLLSYTYHHISASPVQHSMPTQSNAHEPRQIHVTEIPVAKSSHPLPNRPKEAKCHDCRIWEPSNLEDRFPAIPCGHHPRSNPNENRFSILAQLDSRGEKSSWAFDFIPPSKRFTARRRGKRGGRHSKTKAKQGLRPDIFDDLFADLRSKDTSSTIGGVSSGSPAKTNDIPQSRKSEVPQNSPSRVESVGPAPHVCSITKPPPARSIFSRQSSQSIQPTVPNLTLGRRTPPIHPPLQTPSFQQSRFYLPATFSPGVPSPSLSPILKKTLSRRSSLSTTSITSTTGGATNHPRLHLLQDASFATHTDREKHSNDYARTTTRRNSRFFPHRAAAAAAIRALSLPPSTPVTPLHYRSKSSCATTPCSLPPSPPLALEPSLTPPLILEPIPTPPWVTSPLCHPNALPSPTPSPSSTARALRDYICVSNSPTASASVVVTPSPSTPSTPPSSNWRTWQDCRYESVSTSPYPPENPYSPIDSVPSAEGGCPDMDAGETPEILHRPNSSDPAPVGCPSPTPPPLTVEERASLTKFLAMGHAEPCWCRSTQASVTSTEVLPTPSQLFAVQQSIASSSTTPADPSLPSETLLSTSPDVSSSIEFEHILPSPTAFDADGDDDDGWTLLHDEARVGRPVVRHVTTPLTRTRPRGPKWRCRIPVPASSIPLSKGKEKEKEKEEEDIGMEEWWYLECDSDTKVEKGEGSRQAVEETCEKCEERVCKKGWCGCEWEWYWPSLKEAREMGWEKGKGKGKEKVV
ncbi:hypothetical protein BU16DRAFT_232765 [Lophium mytilinum]|uniref:Uncharacterized protein n=1 Tax=Lophium mytilinum TaxID=390894 RepID=A0A6A6R6E3_9PEZI|nr:hypothetical protein BU16DRAFT_232765 [Lophium mytilinum]